MAESPSLTGAHLSVGQPCADVVAVLKNALEKAKAGEITGVCIAIVNGAGSTSKFCTSSYAESGKMMIELLDCLLIESKLLYDQGEDPFGIKDSE